MASIHHVIALSPFSYAYNVADEGVKWFECDVGGDGSDVASNADSHSPFSPARIALDAPTPDATTFDLTIHVRGAENVKGAENVLDGAMRTQCPIYVSTSHWSRVASLSHVEGPMYRSGARGRYATFNIQAVEISRL